MFTCCAAIPGAFANVILYDTFCELTREGMEFVNAVSATHFFDAICGEVWRECKRKNDMCAWELFKGYCNKYLHECGELASDRVCMFTWAGSIY